MALDGDINGDGYNDLFLSAKMWDEPEIEEGKHGYTGEVLKAL